MTGLDAAARDLVLARIRDVPDFPEPGIMFKDITPLLADPAAFAAVVAAFAENAGPAGLGPVDKLSLIHI